MATHPVETYLKTLHEIYQTGSGTAEESYYRTLATLLDEIGKHLKPRVRCVPQIKNIGAGEPDFGLYTANRFQRAGDERPIEGGPPERGVVEAKPWTDEVSAIAASTQVANYWRKYKIVLVTNYREFILVGPDAEGKLACLESFQLAESESAFRAGFAHPRKTADERGDRLVEFLKRVMLHAVPLTDPEDVAWFLASYAREARARVEAAAGLPGLAALRKALEEALGMKFEGDKGEQFFRTTFVQTLFYGIFSSWVLWSREHPKPGDRFNWHDAAWTLHVPMIASLFEQIATPKRLKPLGVDEVLDRAGLVLNRVDRPSFFQKFEQERAVQYFYEPFLKAYDPALRKDLGVWYTPPEIVKYQVERVDRVLREELDLPDGLADDRVVVLDPCCGTGAYLVETLKRIQHTFEEKGSGALTAYKLKQVAKTRVFGFEILPAPFVVAHLQLGLMLQRLGMPFSHDSDERAGVYLTNALTGWEPPQKPKDELPLFPELMAERDAANKVKCEAPILVILGNPPYNAFAGTSPEEEGGLVEPYKEGLTTPVEKGGWGIKKFNLDDLYVRFLRIAERRIVKSGRGVVSYISNFSYLGDPSFVVMRKRFLEEFDSLWLDCMNGDSRETGKLTPDGRPDPSVFSTEEHPVGIRVGTAICVLVRKDKREKAPTVRFQHYWGVTKRRDLLASLGLEHLDRKYQRANPTKANRHSFRPASVADVYVQWPRLPQLQASILLQGMDEDRANALVALEVEDLAHRMRRYFDKAVDWVEFAKLGSGLSRPSAAFDPQQTRVRAQESEEYSRNNIQSFIFRVCDTRYCYYSALPNVWKRRRPDLKAQTWVGNSFVLTRAAGVARPEGVPFFFAKSLFSRDCMRGHAVAFPLLVRQAQVAGPDELLEQHGFEPTVKPNVSPTSRGAHLTMVRRRPPKFRPSRHCGGPVPRP